MDEFDALTLSITAVALLAFAFGILCGWWSLRAENQELRRAMTLLRGQNEAYAMLVRELDIRSGGEFWKPAGGR